MPKRVLVVDDAIFMRNKIKSILEEAGYEIIGEASNGREAVERFQVLKPDVTLMDVVMPFKTGIEATKEILKLDGRAIVIMCSALGQESLVLQAIEAGAVDYLIKPFRPEDVLEVVGKALGERPSAA
jgi:two-component system chemotaxis response regulator CheY